MFQNRRLSDAVSTPVRGSVDRSGIERRCEGGGDMDVASWGAGPGDSTGAAHMAVRPVLAQTIMANPIPMVTQARFPGPTPSAASAAVPAIFTPYPAIRCRRPDPDFVHACTRS